MSPVGTVKVSVTALRKLPAWPLVAICEARCSAIACCSTPDTVVDITVGAVGLTVTLMAGGYCLVTKAVTRVRSDNVGLGRVVETLARHHRRIEARKRRL